MISAAASTSPAATPATVQGAHVPTISGFTEYTEQQHCLFGQWKETVGRTYRQHGFTEFTPRPVELAEVLRKKGGISHQIFSISRMQDGSLTEMALPFDRTVPLAIWVDKYIHEIVFPFKRYDISYSFRGEHAQAGRFRAFYQADVDIIDRDLGIAADVECISTIYTSLNNLGFRNFTINLNHIGISKAMAAFLTPNKDQQEAILRAIDKIDKLSQEDIVKEIMQVCKNLNPESVAALVKKFAYRGPVTGFTLDPAWGPAANNSFKTLMDVFKSLEQYDIRGESITFCPAMVRGLDYYTGIVFETFLKNGSQFGSIASGGRYDKLVEGIGEGKNSLQGVGGSIGLTRLFDVFLRTLRTDGRELENRSTANVTVCYREESLKDQALQIAKALRDRGQNVDFYSGNAARIKDKLNYADRKKVPYMIMVMDPASIVVRDMRNKIQSDLKSVGEALDIYFAYNAADAKASGQANGAANGHANGKAKPEPQLLKV